MKYRWAPSLGEFESSPEKVWGVEPCDPNGTDPCVFCGLYGLPDFYALWRYKGKKYVWWAGSDIRHFINGYWLDDKGDIRVTARPLAAWINKNCESWVENSVERKALEKLGIGSFVCPSFLGDVNEFKPTLKRTDKKRYYASVSGNDFVLYGWDKINNLARQNPDIEYHLYGNTEPWLGPENVIVHGRVPKEVMNKDIESMTGAIRLVPFDGFSEVVAKAVLMGQEVISEIDYPFLKAKNPREELLSIINKYPWNTK